LFQQKKKTVPTGAVLPFQTVPVTRSATVNIRT
jgi:hypothetical protein